MASNAQKSGLAMGQLCSEFNGLAGDGHVLVTTADNMGWDNVQLSEVDDITRYVIDRLGAGTAKERRKLKKLQAQKNPHTKTKKRLDEK